MFKSKKLRDPRSRIDFCLLVYFYPAFFLLPTSHPLPSAVEFFLCRPSPISPVFSVSPQPSCLSPGMEPSHSPLPTGLLASHPPPYPRGSFLECRSEHVPLMLETCPQSWLVSEHFQQTISVLIMGLPSILQNLCHILPISQRRRLRIRVSQRGSLPSRQGGRSSLEPLSLFIRPSLPRCLKGPPGLPALACPPAAAFHTPLPRALWPEVLPDT